MRRTYLDWAAAAPVSAPSLKVFRRALLLYGNPGSPHTEGRAARTLLEGARVRIARLAETKPEGVVFTAGATEANALAIIGAVRAKGVAGAHVLYHPGQHASVLGAMALLEREGAITETYTSENLAGRLRPETVLVSTDAVGSETGERFPTRDLRRVLDTHHAGILLHVDAVQLPLTGSFTLTHLGADLLTLDAQKVGGVRGIGALLLRRGVAVEPLMLGGGQEGDRRPGTESAALAVAFAAALEGCDRGRDAFAARAARDRTAFLACISEIPEVVVNEGTVQVPHILNLSLLGRDTDYLVALLDRAGFAVSTKSACESDSSEGSRAVLAQTGDAARAASTLRISWGPTTPSRSLTRFATSLMEQVRFLDQNAI